MFCSLTAGLSWREFRLLQSRLGWLCLLAATTHCLVNGMSFTHPAHSKIFKMGNCLFFANEQVP